MAAYERRFLIFLLCSLFDITVSDFSPKFKDFLPSVLDRHLKVSRHLPVCVIYRQPGKGSALENVVHELWSSKKENFATWEFGSYSFGENTKIHYRQPSSVPLLRCFLGLTSPHDYNDQPRKTKVNKWLDKLVKNLQDQIQDATEDCLDTATGKYNYTIVAFPDHSRHSEIEEMVFQVSEKNYNSKAYISHIHSINNRDIRLKYDVREIPTVIVIHRKDLDNTVYRFTKQHMTYSSLDIFMKARTIPVPHYNMNMFEHDVLGLGVQKQMTYIPKLITFYSYWAPEIYAYLSALNRTIDELRDLGIELSFGLVDLTDEMAESRKIVSRYIHSRIASRLPFSLLYYKDVNDTLHHIHFKDERPTPMTIYNWLSSYESLAGIVPETYQPYGVDDPSALSHLNEGPYGKSCYITTHNLTDNTPQELWWSWTVPQRKLKVKKQTKKAWHDVFGTENINKQLQRLDDIPLLSHKFWAEVIEKSHAPLHPFLPGREWAGEVTKVALVIFIMADCRSCQNGMETFKNLQNTVKYIAGGSVYLVNCTEEVDLCQNHDIRGFPTITAFRGLGWLESSSCISEDSRKLYRSYTRMDYHGVLQAKPIMVWFGEIAGSAVKDLLFNWPKDQIDEDVRLLGILTPKGSRYLPIPPGRKQNYYFSYECFRLACERLYGKAKCYSVYSKEVPQKEFKDKDLDVIVSKIIFERRDGVSAILTQLGHTLSQSLENHEDLKLHMFHREHRYRLWPGQKCEDDHSSCTDIITAFTLDHSRLPITQIDSNAFHTSDILDAEDLPILIALVYKDNLTETATFGQVLNEIAYQFYNELIVMTLDVEEYPAWAGQFVPKDYNKLMIKHDGDPKVLFDYPRLCIVKKNDHTHAAFYPPLEESRWISDWFELHKLKQFIVDYFDDSLQLFIPTEHF